MTAPRFSPKVARIIGIATAVVALSAIASAQRFGGSGQTAQRNSQAQTPPPATANPASAQPAGGRGASQNRPGQDFSLSWEWWKDDAVRKEMKLSDRQAGQISRLYENRVRQLKPVWEEMERQRAILNKMSEERTVEVPVYAIQVGHVEGLRSELNKTRTIMLYEINKVLTPDQTQKLREILDRRRKARGNGGQR